MCMELSIQIGCSAITIDLTVGEPFLVTGKQAFGSSFVSTKMVASSVDPANEANEAGGATLLA